MENSILVVALDGLDYELIQKYGCDELTEMEEFGKIDNHTGISKIMTSEEFACFITGESWEKHGIKGLFYWNNSKLAKLRDILVPEYLAKNVRGFTFLKKTLGNLFDLEKLKHKKSELESDTLFEKVPKSKPMYIPSYNPSMVWFLNGFGGPLKYGYTVEDIMNFWKEREFKVRKRNLEKEIENNSRNFLMCHFHLPDTFHHFYADKYLFSEKKETNIDEKDLENFYREINSFVKEIKRKAEDKYDIVIFMSDHGLPTEKEHNENAFYSCNKELFGDKEPHITDFHDKILELTETGKEKIEDIDV